MQVHCGEGVANHTGPEPCARVRGDVGEASAGECIGQPSSRETVLIPGADDVCLSKRFRGHTLAAWDWLRSLKRRNPTMFAHWTLGPAAG